MGGLVCRATMALRVRSTETEEVQQWIVRGHGQTHVGRERQRNEDAFLVDDKLGLYVVADGMGGHRAGDVASVAAVEAAANFIRHKGKEELSGVATGDLGRDALEKVARRAVAYAARAVYEKAISDPRYNGMGTTLSMLVLAGPYGVIAHVGDSRVYRLREGQAEMLTRDHTVTAELVALGVITPTKFEPIRCGTACRAPSAFDLWSART